MLIKEVSLKRKIALLAFLVAGSVFFILTRSDVSTVALNGFRDSFRFKMEDANFVEAPETALGGTCSPAAAKLGSHQKVISFCVYGDNPVYWSGLDENLKAIQKLYPGWYVRLYTREPTLSKVSHLLRGHPHLALCDVDNLPPPYHNISTSHPMVWRFTPMADPQVDVAIFRDSDSKISQREVDAVNAWLATNATLHSMRDHPFHTVPILGGMWGVNLSPPKRRILRNSLNKMISESRGRKEKGFDQELLTRYVWPEFWLDSVCHDSYTCLSYFSIFNSRSWPTKREDKTDFVGSAIFRDRGFKVLPQCPWFCRPSEHKDWIYC